MQGFFVHVPGNNNKTVQSVLDWYPKKGYFGWHDTTIEQLKEVPKEQRKNFFSFAIVRNPFERLWAVYNRYKPSGKTLCLSSRKTLCTFERFVETVCCGDHIFLTPDEIKKTGIQCLHVTNDAGELIVDYVLQYEQLHYDFRTVVEKLDLPATVTIPYEISSNLPEVMSKFTPAMIEQVRSFYKEDFALFGILWE